MDLFTHPIPRLRLSPFDFKTAFQEQRTSRTFSVKLQQRDNCLHLLTFPFRKQKIAQKIWLPVVVSCVDFTNKTSCLLHSLQKVFPNLSLYGVKLSMPIFKISKKLELWTKNSTFIVVKSWNFCFRVSPDAPFKWKLTQLMSEA